MLQARAIAKWIRISPRKMRLVADMVRGKGVDEAVNMLHFSTKRASEPIEKTIRSALANLMVQDEATKLGTEEVYVHEIRVDEGPTGKRWRPRAMGRATKIRKRTSHVTVIVAEKLRKK